MRKVFLGALAAVVMLSANAGNVSAAGAGCGRYYTDADNDGICDNAGSMCAYTDEDGDGVCDNYTAGQNGGNSRGCGNGRGYQGGRGNGRRCR